jgi:hypothetical protein
MTMRALRFLRVAGSALIAAALGCGAAGAAEKAQQPNPVFLQTQALAAQIAESSLPGDVKARMGQAFAILSSQQQYLWQQAGLYDAGQCDQACIDDYIAHATPWGNGMFAFIAEATRLLSNGSGSAQVTLENRTAQTLDLYIDTQMQCRALLNFTCTAQTTAGFHALAAQSGETVAGSETVTLGSGQSYTFTVH